MIQPRFDEEIHAPLRLRICAYLSRIGEAEFSALREDLEVSDSVLSKHLTRLEDAGYLRRRRAALSGHSWVWLSLTKQGRRAFAGHLEALRQIAESADLSDQDDMDDPDPSSPTRAPLTYGKAPLT